MERREDSQFKELAGRVMRTLMGLEELHKEFHAGVDGRRPATDDLAALDQEMRAFVDSFGYAREHDQDRVIQYDPRLKLIRERVGKILLPILDRYGELRRELNRLVPDIATAHHINEFLPQEYRVFFMVQYSHDTHQEA